MKLIKTNKELKHVIGLYNEYDIDLHKDCIYFAEDVGIIIVNGVMYGGTTEEPESPEDTEDWHFKIVTSENTSVFDFIDGSKYENNTPCNVEIDWGDGNKEAFNGSTGPKEVSHKYDKSGKYEIKCKVLNPEAYNYKSADFAEKLPIESPIITSLSKNISEVHYKPLYKTMKEYESEFEKGASDIIENILNIEPIITGQGIDPDEFINRKFGLTYLYFIVSNIDSVLEKISIEGDIFMHPFPSCTVNNLDYGITYCSNEYSVLWDVTILNIPKIKDNVKYLAGPLFRGLAFEDPIADEIEEIGEDENIDLDELLKILMDLYKEKGSPLILPSNLQILGGNEVFGRSSYIVSEIELHNNLLMLDNALRNHLLLGEITIPESVKQIIPDCLYSPTLKKIRIPSKLYDAVKQEYGDLQLHETTELEVY